MTVESEDDVIGLRRAGAVVAETLRTMGAAVAPGVSTAELDEVGRAVALEHRARPTASRGGPASASTPTSRTACPPAAGCARETS